MNCRRHKQTMTEQTSYLLTQTEMRKSQGACLKHSKTK